MGLLGMLAAGGAVGAMQGSNMNVQAQNQLEMENMRANREDSRDALRQQYLDKQFNATREDNKAAAKYAAQAKEVDYQRGRADKTSDADLKHKQALEISGMTEAGRNSRAAANNASRMAAAASKAGGAGGGDSEFGKMDSNLGRTLGDIMRLKLADNPQDAYKLYTSLDIVAAAQKNPMNKFDDKTLLDSVGRLTRGLIPSKPGEGLLNGGGAQSPIAGTFVLDPKTGKLIPQ